MIARDANEVLAAWETSSQYWDKHQAIIEQMFAPLTSALITAASIQPGQAVLDVGGGGGEPSLTLSNLVAIAGSVTYTDPADGMLKTARGEAERRGLSNITFHRAPAETLPFEDNSFDAVVGRLSAMFFAQPEIALKEILRVTKPGGVVALLVWAAREANPFFSVISDVLNRFVPSEPEDEDAPAAFRFSKPEKLAGLFRDAGAGAVAEQLVRFRIESSIGVEKFWELRTEMSDTFRRKLSQLGSLKLAEVQAATTKALAPYFPDGKMSFPAETLIVSGQK